MRSATKALISLTRKTDFGGFLDIVLDFAFYGAIPLGFIFADPAANALAAELSPAGRTD